MGEHRLCSQEKQYLGNRPLCVTQLGPIMNAPDDDLEESTSWLVWGLYQGSPWYCRWKSKQTPVCPECPWTVGTLWSVPSPPQEAGLC